MYLNLIGIDYFLEKISIEKNEKMYEALLFRDQMGYEMERDKALEVIKRLKVYYEEYLPENKSEIK